jgi:hypothetical protein
VTDSREQMREELQAAKDWYVKWNSPHGVFEKDYWAYETNFTREQVCEILAEYGRAATARASKPLEKFLEQNLSLKTGTVLRRELEEVLREIVAATEEAK